MRHVLPLAFVLLLLPVFSLMFFVPVVHASIAVVQQTSVHVDGVTSNGLAFTSSVTSGNVVVVGILTNGETTLVSSVTDSRGSSYTQAVESSNVAAEDTVAIYYAALSSSGSDTVTVTVSATAAFDMYIFEVSGVAASGVTHGDGFGVGTATGTSSTSFVPPAFVLGVIGTLTGFDTFAAGPGFTGRQTTGDVLSFAEYSTSVSSPTTFPATLSTPSGGSDNWVEVGAAFPAPPPPIPEYPLGLPLLAIFMVIGYGIIRRRTRNDHD